jgi:hypothetical protein
LKDVKNVSLNSLGAHMVLVLVMMFASLSSATLVSVAAVDFGVLVINPSMSVSEGLQVMQNNLLQLEKVTVKTRALAQDQPLLIAFPEDAFVGPMFSSRASIAPFLIRLPPINTPMNSPANSSSYPLVFALCRIAAENNAVIIVGVAEQGDDGRQYNTVVAVSSEGLIGRARKVHLYYEPQFDPGPLFQPERLFVSPVFGVVGMCVCFDVLFADILSELAKADVVVSVSWWVNVNPIAPGVAMHAGVARLLVDKVIVAPSSGYNWANSGSGVFSGNHSSQVFNAGWNSETQVALLCSIQIRTSVMRRTLQSSLIPKVPRRMQTHKFDAVVGSAPTTIGDAFCNVTFRFDTVLAGEIYALISFAGPYIPEASSPPLFWLDLCSVVRCSESACASIYYPIPNVTASSVFTNLELNAAFESQAEVPLGWTVDGFGKVLAESDVFQTVSSMTRWSMTD